MRAAFWVGCAALLLSACSSEPVQQATAAHVAPGLKASMSSSGEANCAMIGGSLSVCPSTGWYGDWDVCITQRQTL
ncbi:protein [Escherichia coli]|uniref:Protein n=1 Tax=Escherichia coli TaxID=562 RepID=A0A376VLZ3_ECOLX|nr:protein [Escherichia coli]